MKEKKCALCGRLFEPKTANNQYCSPACKKAGQKATRRKWEASTGYREKQKAKRREERSVKRPPKVENIFTHDTQSNFREELSRRAASGVSLAKMLLAKERGNLDPEYWEAFADCEREADGSVCTVNGFSVFDEDFGENVVSSIIDRGFVKIERILSKKQSPF